MSISENVGALSNYFAKVLSGRMYSTLRSGGKKILKQMPTMWELARRSEEMMKGMVLPGTLFEELGLQLHRARSNGHDIKELVTTLRNMRNLEGPAAAARGHQEGQGLRPGGKGSDQVAWPGSVRSGQRHHLQGKGHRPYLLAGVRPVAVRHGRARSAHRRHHARDARRLGHGRILEEVSAALFRRGHRRTACRDVRGRPRLRGLQARWSLSTPRSCNAPTTS